jgi:hypothetical protein
MTGPDATDISSLPHLHALRYGRPGPAPVYPDLSHVCSMHALPYTSPHNLRMTGTVNTDRNRFHGCTLHAARLSSYCTRPHPCTVTAAHHVHTRPPDIPARLAYQIPLVNTYCTSDLCRPRALDDVQNASKRDGRVDGIPPRPRSSSSDILHTRGPPHIGPRGDCVFKVAIPHQLANATLAQGIPQDPCRSRC